MQVSTPTTAVAAAQLLADLAEISPPVSPVRSRHDDDTPWQAIQRLWPAPWGARVDRSAQMRVRADAQESGIQLWLPPVLLLASFPAEQAKLLIGHLSAEIGNPAPALHPNAVLRARRPRMTVLGDPSGAPATAEGSWALTATILGARQSAEDLTTWAQSLPTRQAEQARTEARVYSEHAAATEALLPASFGWVAGVPDPIRATEAPPTVPAVVRVHLGSTPESG